MPGGFEDGVLHKKHVVTYSPPGTGGEAAHQENIAKPPLKAQTGWSFWTDHPVRAYQRMPSAICFDGTATPPVPGGEYAIQSQIQTPPFAFANLYFGFVWSMSAQNFLRDHRSR
jgi:hypothetical protein